MNCTIPNQSFNEELCSTNVISPNFDEKVMSHSTSALIFPFTTSAHFSNYLKTQQKNQDFKKIFYEKNEDQIYIQTYTLKKKISCETAAITDHIKIFKAKNLLVEVIALKKQLENIKYEMSVDDKRFEVKYNMANEIKKEISDRLVKFDALVMRKVLIALSQRSKKRKGIHKRKLKYFNLKKNAAKKMSEKHTVIDKLLSKKGKEVNEIKREESLRRQADSVLHEVGRKKFEAKKILSTLDAILKLRQVRREEEVAKGGYCSSSLTDMFNSVISHFRELWTRQLERYQLEEKGLKVMLEGDSGPELNWSKSKYEAILCQWEQAIFGGTMSRNDGVHIQKDVESLIEVRRQWDRFLVVAPTVMSSRIPLGWVLPSGREDENWLKLTKKNKSVSQI